MSEIREFVMAEPLFDNHEHQAGFSDLEGRRDKLGYREFVGYAEADLATALGTGTAEDRPDTSTDEGFFQMWPFVRTTGYGQATELACEAVLGVAYTVENVGAIRDALREFVRDKDAPQVFGELYEKANVRWVLNDCCWDSPTRLDYFAGKEHPGFFGQALRYDDVLVLGSREQVEGWEKAMGRSIQRLADLDRALDDYTERAQEAGRLACMKSAMPYSRRLAFENSSHADAERAFERVMQGRPAELKPLHDYLFHRFVQRAREFDLPVQLHTGYLAGNWGDPTQGDPAPLVAVLQRYKGVRFDLFHAGWPYSELIGAIGKAFPNVWLDMCWAWTMNPAQMQRILVEWLAAVPHNKVFAFGGDTGSPFAMVGYALQARDGIAASLEAAVEGGLFDVGAARDVARRIMHENACRHYGME
jgi:predicted TIM-barrel fold metal-dependent hydrolase